ncbi:MAG: O-antigen ligase family protein [Sphingomonadaceae bacterium]|nr:O-antigen ligase family protein [Sphingomonadaceae bacterium]
MLDLILFLFVCFMLLAGLRRPYLWVLTYLYIDILAPQKIGWGLTQVMPISLIAFCAAFAGWLLVDPKRGSQWTLRQSLLVALLLYCGWTTMNADFPEDALVKWEWVWKAMVFAIFLPLTLTTRMRIEGAALTMVLTAGAIIIATGMKTALGGGGYEQLSFFVNNNSGLYESSTLSTVAIGIIPLILWFTHHGTVFPPDWRVKAFAYALVFACLLVPIGTEARTGLICMGVLAMLALRDVKRRFTFIAAGAMLVTVALPFLPQSYYERMGLITGYKEDSSASTRVAVWKWTIDYALENPTGGGFDAFRGNRFAYRMPVKEETGEHTVSIEYREVVDEGRAYHSAIFELLGEQGWTGLGIWLWFQALGLWQMERIRRRWRKRTGAAEQWQAPLASALQVAQIIYLVGSLFQGIAYQPFIMMLAGLQVGLWIYCRRFDSRQATGRRPGRPPRPARARGNAVAAREAALR